MGFFDGAGAGIIGAVGGLLGNVGSNSRQMEAEQRQHRYNLQLASHQNTMNMENWQKIFDTTNEYNSPIAQMQRLKEAGINPHMGFANGSGANTASMGSVNTDVGDVQTSAGKSIFEGILEKYQAGKMNAIQIKLAEEQVKQQQINTELMQEGLDDEKMAKRYGSKQKHYRTKAQYDYDVADSPEDKSGNENKLSNYDMGVRYDLEEKSLRNEATKVQMGLQKATASNLISNDELVRMQTMIVKGQAAIYDTEEFKKLPAWLKAGISALLSKIGAQ